MSIRLYIGPQKPNAAAEWLALLLRNGYVIVGEGDKAPHILNYGIMAFTRLEALPLGTESLVFI